jgi:hypothetical protein
MTCCAITRERIPYMTQATPSGADGVMPSRTEPRRGSPQPARAPERPPSWRPTRPLSAPPPLVSPVFKPISAPGQ